MKTNKEKNNGVYKPSKLTYYICKDESGTIKIYGKTEPDLVMTTKYKDIETFTKKEDYVNALLDNGITIPEETEL